MLTIRDACAADESAWRVLWKGYCDFYEVTVPEEITRVTWQRILDSTSQVYCRVAVIDDAEVIGFSNYVLHEGTWGASSVCYLEDLFVDPAERGKGVGRALIQDLIDLGKQYGWSRLYWHTKAGNHTARRLYDTFTPADDFVRYRLTPADYKDDGISI